MLKILNPYDMPGILDPVSSKSHQKISFLSGTKNQEKLWLCLVLRSNSTADGWQRVVWPRKARLWLTAHSLVKCRAFSHSWPCRKPHLVITQLKQTKVLIHTALSLHATRRSTNPNRYWVTGIHLNWIITALLVFSVAFHFCFFCSSWTLFLFSFLSNCSARTKDPGGLSECSSALINRRHSEIPSDLAGSAWLWPLLYCSQVSLGRLVCRQRLSCTSDMHFFFKTVSHGCLVV